MNFHVRNLSVTLMAAASGLALSLFLSPAFAQGQDSPERHRFDANGMPTTHSTPEERAETARINRQIGSDNRAVDARSSEDAARYQGERSRYEGQLQDNRSQRAEYDQKSAAYDEKSAAYERMRDRYADERAAYRRGAFPGRYARWTLMQEAGLTGARVQLINGRRVGTVTGTSRGREGSLAAVQVRLDDNRMVWIDASDVRYNQGDRLVMTNLNRGDLRRMADHRQ